MSWIDWTLLGVFILGFILFVVGANIYNAVVGYTGLYLSIGAVMAYLIIYIYKELTKPPAMPKPSEPAPAQNP
jgi:hypothetical protein